MDAEEFASRFEPLRGELCGYLSRMVALPAVAEELVQSAAVRSLGSLDAIPSDEREFRAWVFRVATNLAIDELRRARRWSSGVMERLRATAEGDVEFVAFSSSRRGSPETRTIAREHLAVCFACTGRALEPRRMAALLLREVYDFSLEQAARILEARPAQVKNWLQEARREMTSLYGDSCRLVAKGGTCHQCVELNGYFNGEARSPLDVGEPGLAGRLKLLRELRRTAAGRWHRELMQFLDES